MPQGYAADAIALGLGYLLGSIPFGLLLTRLTGGPDLRTVGSGNIGATNVLRTGKRGLAAATLAGDLLKGTAAVILAAALFDGRAALVAGLGAFLGHVYPVWLRFKGGKGVATYIGVLLGLAWPFALVFGAIWLVVAGVSRYSSLAALVASAALPPLLWYFTTPALGALFFILSVLLWFNHRGNINRLRSGTETRIGKRTA